MIRSKQKFGRYMSSYPSTGSNAKSNDGHARENRESVDEEVLNDESEDRRTDSDRRGTDRRRSARGLFELRARRDRVVEDRRQLERRSPARARFAFWRRRAAEE